MAGPSSTAYLLTENLMLRGTISSSATAADSNPLNALDYRTTSYWRPAAAGACWIESTFAAPVIIDSVGLYRHNCASAGASVQVQYHDGSDWVTVQTLSSLTDNQCVLRRWAGVAATRWRVLFNTTDALVLGVLVLGRAVRLPACSACWCWAVRCACPTACLPGSCRPGLADRPTCSATKPRPGSLPGGR